MGQGLGKREPERKNDVVRKHILIEGMRMGGHSTLAASLKLAIKNKDEDDGKEEEEQLTREEELEKTKRLWMIFGGWHRDLYKGYPINSVKFAFGGRGRPRQINKNRLYERALGLLYVVDSSDCTRLEEAKTELDLLRKKPELNGAVIIAVANKQDLPDAKTADEVADIINDGAEERIKVLPASAQTGEGVLECFDWLIDEVTGQHKIEAVAEPWVEVVTDVTKDGKAGMESVKVALKKLVSNFRIVG